jgi:hypothetical protein
VTYDEDVLIISSGCEGKDATSILEHGDSEHDGFPFSTALQ